MSGIIITIMTSVPAAVEALMPKAGLSVSTTDAPEAAEHLIQGSWCIHRIIDFLQDLVVKRFSCRNIDFQFSENGRSCFYFM